MNKTILWVLVVILIVLGGWYFIAQRDDVAQNGTENDLTDDSTTFDENTQDQINDEDGGTKEVTVTYSSSGFTPGEVTINSGDTVIFRDSGTGNMWVASAMHPTHRGYPGSDIAKCGTLEAAQIFDQCEDGTEFRFTFNETGTWAYHNHSQASHFGRIIVE